MDFVGFSKHRNDYNAVGGPRALCVNIPVEDPTYHDSWGNMDNTKHDAYRFYVIEFNGEKNLYLCYDYQTKKNSGEYLPGDKVFNDWVIKIIPADGKKPEIKELPKSHDEVEINLSVNDEKENGDYIATKLSIHIRALTDVEVFIPVARDYYCDVDDMAIVYSHKLDPNYQYSNPGENAAGNVYTYTYTVAGDYVVEGVTYTANEAINVIVTYEENGIRVKTQGMTQAALDYLQYTYNDGITFEVWNYFNSVITNEALETIPVTRADLKPMFDQSTVTFTASDHPEQYINAFAMLYEYKKLDLHVYMKENKPYLLDVTTNAEGRVVSETQTWALLLHDTLVDEHHAVGDLPGEGHLVGDDYHRHTGLGEVLDQIEDLSDHLRVQSGRGLVEEHHVGFHGQRPDDRYALLLASGQPLGVHLRLVGQSDPGEEIHRLLLGIGLRHLAQFHRRQHDVLLDRHVGEQVELLEHHTYLGSEFVDVHLPVGGDRSFELYGASGRFLQEVDRTEER